jgi:thioredoxin-dependent peroxiredoxin
LKIGDVVENFRLYDQFNNEFDLYKNLDQSVLLVFYPKDNTLVCTAQLVDYALIQKELISIGIKIVGINIDPVKSHNSFCFNNNINFPVLSDSEKTVSKYYGALNLIGKNKRKLVLIGKDKRIKYIKSTLPMFFIHSVHLLNKIGKMQLL